MSNGNGNGNEPERWKLKREVSLPDIVSFLAAAFAVVYAYATLDKRLIVLETNQATQRDVDKKQDEEVFRWIGRVEATLDRINQKLDKLIELPPQRR